MLINHVDLPATRADQESRTFFYVVIKNHKNSSGYKRWVMNYAENVSSAISFDEAWRRIFALN